MLFQLERPFMETDDTVFLDKMVHDKRVQSSIEMIVAMAAPLIPISSQKMKIGSSITLVIAPISMVNIAFFG